MDFFVSNTVLFIVADVEKKKEFRVDLTTERFFEFFPNEGSLFVLPSAQTVLMLVACVLFGLLEGSVTHDTDTRQKLFTTTTNITLYR